MKYDKAVILVFAKAPVAGTVNTRLIPAIGVDAATRLQESLLHKRLATITQPALCDVILMCAPDVSHVCFTKCESLYAVSLFPQHGKDLGERLANGIKHALRLKQHIIVVGTDAPALDVATIEQAIIALSANDTVLVPAEDGGYVLLGLSAYHAELFENIEWGSDKVLQQTLAKVASLRLTLCTLTTCWDIDREEDYERYLTTLSHRQRLALLS